MRYTTTALALVVTLCVPSVASAGGTTYTVRPGDSLWLIAMSNGVALDDLLSANGLVLSSTIHPGQSLELPAGGEVDDDDLVSGPVNSTTSGSTNGTDGERVTVRPGDSLWSVATNAGVSLGALLAANDLTIDRTIHPGQSLVLPSAGGTSSTPATTSPNQDAGTSTYVVRPGDGLTTIARRVGVGVRALLDANALSMTTIIHPGQRLTVPVSSVPQQVAGSEHLVPVFERAAAEAGIPADLLMAVAYVESRWVESARSSHGAVGVGQLMPGTAAWVATDLMGEPGLDIANTADNIRISAHLLAWLLDEAAGSAERALAMYLQGVHGVRVNGVSPAATVYSNRVSGIRPRFQ